MGRLCLYESVYTKDTLQNSRVGFSLNVKNGLKMKIVTRKACKFPWLTGTLTSAVRGTIWFLVSVCKLSYLRVLEELLFTIEAWQEKYWL